MGTAEAQEGRGGASTHTGGVSGLTGSVKSVEGKGERGAIGGAGVASGATLGRVRVERAHQETCALDRGLEAGQHRPVLESPSCYAWRDPSVPYPSLSLEPLGQGCRALSTGITLHRASILPAAWSEQEAGEG